MEAMTFDFGEEFNKPVISTQLTERFGETPFSVLHTNTGRWQDANRDWLKLGIKSELGRVDGTHTFHWGRTIAENFSAKIQENSSIFSARLSQIMYQWFCPENGTILDPFAGGSVRGIVAGVMGHSYTGIDIRAEQVEENEKQARELAGKLATMPQWICGDSRTKLDDVNEKHDMIFTCPPYSDLEVYSDLEGDLSNMDYSQFLEAYREILCKACTRLKDGCFAAIVVAEIRDGQGNLRGFVPDTIRAFQDAGLNFYNDLVLVNQVGTACLRTKQFNASRKILKIHQNVLVFLKGKQDKSRNWLEF